MKILEKKVYISGKISGEDRDKVVIKFFAAQFLLEQKGHKVMNPAALPEGFDYADYMEICYKMIDACEAILCLNDWASSPGAMMEHVYATENNKNIYFIDEVIDVYL
jgi:hypothetical protein